VFEYPYFWCSSTLASILKKQEYLGHTVNFKTVKHFKDKKSKYAPEDKYKKLLSELKEKVRISQLKAAIKVNY